MDNRRLSELHLHFPLAIKDKKLKLLTVDILGEYCSVLMSKEFNRNLVHKISENFTYKKLYDILLQRVLGYNSINDSGEYRAILTDNSNEVYGSITMYFCKDSVELGYYIVPKCRRKGYATEMVKRFIEDIPLREYGVKCIIARVIADNRASVKVLERLNFKELGKEVENGSIEVLVLRKEVTSICI